MEPVDPNAAERIRGEPRSSRGNETHFERILGSAVGLQIRWSLVTSTATVQEFGVRNSPFAILLPGLGNWDADLAQKLSDRIHLAAEHFALDTANIAYEAEQRMASGKPASKGEG
jgi:hypothetical protein